MQLELEEIKRKGFAKEEKPEKQIAKGIGLLHGSLQAIFKKEGRKQLCLTRCQNGQEQSWFSA